MLLPHLVVILPEFDIKISAIYVKSATPPKCFDLFLIPLVLVKFTSWQVMFRCSAERFYPHILSHGNETPLLQFNTLKRAGLLMTPFIPILSKLLITICPGS
jgi:hypothetical protein